MLESRRQLRSSLSPAGFPRPAPSPAARIRAASTAARSPCPYPCAYLLSRKHRPSRMYFSFAGRVRCAAPATPRRGRESFLPHCRRETGLSRGVLVDRVPPPRGAAWEIDGSGGVMKISSGRSTDWTLVYEASPQRVPFPFSTLVPSRLSPLRPPPPPAAAPQCCRRRAIRPCSRFGLCSQPSLSSFAALAILSPFPFSTFQRREPSFSLSLSVYPRRRFPRSGLSLPPSSLSRSLALCPSAPFLSFYHRRLSASDLFYSRDVIAACIFHETNLEPLAPSRSASRSLPRPLFIRSLYAMDPSVRRRRNLTLHFPLQSIADFSFFLAGASCADYLRAEW